ncbi:hypothetical protein NP493_362g00039 [Ridgeia piscesae]|uniref:Uncharacterized protein n=1 Tax=Ridgeia piscesae TaxID=27915 RepID=A0AAD9L412_RIDPI|nr:hypothetical protein NP493_362g00039 [Ridgeia piscesae]
MAEHSDLVSELNSVERMSTLDRLKHAKKRRTQQLKKFVQYEKQLEKEQHKKRKAGTASANAAASKRPAKKARNVCFISDIMLLEAAARNDLDEGKFSDLDLMVSFIIYVSPIIHCGYIQISNCLFYLGFYG